MLYHENVEKIVNIHRIRKIILDTQEPLKENCVSTLINKSYV